MSNDGWIEWSGGVCPVPPDTLVEVKFRDGKGASQCEAAGIVWGHGGLGGDIVAYRVIPTSPMPRKGESTSATSDQIGGDHYAKHGGMQPIHILRQYLTPDEFRGYTKGVAIAYLLRERDKNGDEDIAKARHHIQLWEELK